MRVVGVLVVSLAAADGFAAAGPRLNGALARAAVARRPVYMKAPVPPKYYSLEWLTTPPRGALAVNDLVEATYRAYAGGKMWYPGKIAEVHENGSYTVIFDDGDEDEDKEGTLDE